MSALPAGLHLATAVAQETEGQPEEMTVTGSRIVQPNLESISPVTSITSEDIGATGKVRVEDIINQLPQAFAAQGSNISNASDGTASVDLRGLGSQRTLVLVNGRRLMAGDAQTGDSSADLNQIPAALVKRVEVLTGGASAVYGADAVAGVVNFIMDDEFEGVRIEGNYSFNQHNNDNSVADVVTDANFPLPEDDVDNGFARDVTFALGIGSAEDKGHAVFYATYRKVAAVLQSEYDYSSCTLNSGDAFTCGGSGTTNPALFVDALRDYATDPLYGTTLDEGTGALRTFDASTDLFNFGPINYYQRPDERYTAGVFTKYALDEHVEAYGEFMYMRDRTVAQIAPSGLFFNTLPDGTLIAPNCDNPLLSAEQKQIWCTDHGLTDDEDAVMFIGRRNVEGGGRQSDLTHESYRAVVGARGPINDVWSYDASMQYGTVTTEQIYRNDFDAQRVFDALHTDDGVTCNSGTPGCVPWNIFSLNPDGTSKVDPAALEFMQVPAVLHGENNERIINANITGDLSDKIALPSADSGLAVNFGTEYRHEETRVDPDVTFVQGSLTGQGGPTTPVNGQFHVRELFTEFRLPLVQGKTGVQDLSFEGGYRFSDYSNDFETDTYKYGLNYSPVDAIRFRGSFQRAVRAPNLGELFAVQSVALDGTQDPCAGAIDPATGLVNGNTQEDCEFAGVDPADFGSIPPNNAAQYNGLQGGQTGLTPEEADTVSFGFVFQPPFVRNLVVALDYFDIDITNVILGGGLADAYLISCVSSHDPVSCSKIHRDSSGSLWRTPQGFVDDISANVSALGTKGIDVQASYAFDIGNAGRLGFNLVGTMLDELTTQLVPGSEPYDCKGLFGALCVVNPEWRHSFRTTWNTPWHGIDVGVNWRYFDGTDLEKTSDFLFLTGEVDATDAHLGSRSYIDATAAVTFADRYTIRVGANNLFDKDPPLVGQANCPTGPCNGNTFAQIYDTLGRQIFATLTMDF